MTKQHSLNSHAAKARLRMERPAPDYPERIDYAKPVQCWQLTDYRTGAQHEVLLFVSPRREKSFRAVVDGREWRKQIGLNALMRKTVASLCR